MSVRWVSVSFVLSLAVLSVYAIAAPRNGDLITGNPRGLLRTYVSGGGGIDPANAFFQSLGTNGRSCNTCHVLEAGWGTSVTRIRARFEATSGTDPIFRLVDGANSPLEDVSTEAKRREAYSMLLNYGVIRVGLPIPQNAEFTLTAVEDPYDFASAEQLSLFRRPLPSTNLRFITGVMWDARETTEPFLPPMDEGEAYDILVESLTNQARGAILGHAQAASPPTAEQLAEIVAFEMSLTTAQFRDRQAGRLKGGNAIGGPRVLANQHFFVGINDPFGNNPTGVSFDTNASMVLFDGFGSRRGNGRRQRARAAIERGEKLFNTLPINITGVAGLNDALGQESVQGHCTTCHNAPNVGNHSVGAPLDIGVSDASRREAGFPLYTLTNILTGETRQTTDPGLALITGKWADIGKFKGPTLRGLAARAPYFHNGLAANLGEVVDFYDSRFNIGITPQQRADLVAFLSAL
ncbi:MAG: c-type cytochrome [Nitrococcus sp.]|nr:c-type cytochrome [Nitrococcus sp.]